MERDRAIEKEEQFSQLLERLEKIRNFTGDPLDFWPSYLDILINLFDAVVGMIIVRNKQEKQSWRQLAFAPANQKLGFYAKKLTERIEEIAMICQEERFALLETEGGYLVAAPLNIGEGPEVCLAVLFLEEALKSQVIEKLKWLQLVADVPQSYHLGRVAVESKIRVEQLAGILDFIVLLNGTKKFMACAIVFCNEIAARLKCDRVSIGWYDKGYVRLKTMSHVDHFDRKMESVQQMETAMEESFDQNKEIIFPQTTDTSAINRAHQDYAHAQSIEYICSLPLRANDEPVAVCLCERSANPFSDTELTFLRLLCEHATSKLVDLKQSDRWVGARLAMAAREKLTRLLGFEHTWAKVAAVFICFILAFVCFVPVPFRVEAPLILRTRTLSYLTAAFDGHIDKVFTRVGDKMKEGDILLTFDQSDLLLEEASVAAEQARYQREFEKARSASQLAEMRVAEALRDQAVAKLELVRYRLDHSVIRAPFDGVVVEGDMHERIGAPIKLGDILFKVARNERMYAELEVSESDIHHIEGHTSGEIALLSRPQNSFKIRVSLVEPVAVSKDKGNVFIVHANFIDSVPDWWQPGLTGIGKLNAGKHTLLWILTRRTIDFLRLRLWW